VKLVDASVLIAAGDPDDPQYREAVALLTSGERLATADLALYEVTNVADRGWRDQDAAARLRERIWAIAEHGEMVRADRALLDDAAALVAEHGLSGYDAAYVAAARRLGATLVSCDVRDLVRPGLAVLP
jgi:predicted nucleic acid-binding protein